MVTHHCISSNINREDAGQFQQAVFNSLPAVFEAFTGEFIFST